MLDTNELYSFYSFCQFYLNIMTKNTWLMVVWSDLQFWPVGSSLKSRINNTLLTRCVCKQWTASMKIHNISQIQFISESFLKSSRDTSNCFMIRYTAYGGQTDCRQLEENTDLLRDDNYNYYYYNIISHNRVSKINLNDLRVCLCLSQVWSNIFPLAADSRHPPNLCWGADQGQHHKALRLGCHSHWLLRLSTSVSEH